MRSFIIHLACSIARRPNAEALRAALPGAEIVDAVDGKDPAQIADMPTLPGTRFRPRYPFALSAGEIGLFISHRLCWQKIVAQDIPAALIVEDDLAFDPMIWPDTLALIEDQARPDRVIRLPAKQRERPVKALARIGQAQLFVPRIIGLQTVATVVGREAAQRLLAASATIDRPVDTFLQMHWATGQPVHTIWPSGVRELTAELGGSTIQKKTPAGGKLAREIKRAVYRTQVALRPQRAG